MAQQDTIPAEFPADLPQPYLRALLENLDTAVVVCDPKGRILLFNRAMARACDRGDAASWQPDAGVRGELEVGADIHRITSCLRNPDGSRAVHGELPLVRALRGEQLHGLEVHLGPDGRRPRTYHVHGQPVRDAEGRLLGALLALHDVTERRLAARLGDCELAVSEALTTEASVADAGAGVLAAVGARLSWPYGELWLADEAEDVLHPAARWVAPGHRPSGPLPDSLPRGSGLAGQVWETGAPRWYADVSTSGDTRLADTASRFGLRSAIAVPIRTPEQFIGVLAFFGATVEEPENSLIALLGGVAAHVGQFLARRRADELALELTRTKDDFLALVGHELRTPLTSIVSHTELLLTDTDGITGDNRTLLESVDRNAHALRQIVADLLDLAGLESGDISLDLDQLDFVELVGAAVSALRPAAEANDVKIEVDAPRVLSLCGDPARLRQLVDQLVSNAVKYSPDGGDVRVRLERHGELAVLTVSDNGMGIPEDERSRLFERFFRSSAATARGITGGSGLGLPLARAIAERHAGNLQARHGRPGTTMAVSLPVRGPDEP
ncbi:ATP-binding protein [Cryptosporangium aurantiacum]|uniref:histidine kinase n=1 Tax=Cryptosporangium aurantiacum TaxID=134849 RepID=A0A1M7RE19_9ACTN|nr:ATP-binding protein [Cryptosporangium aurantiacum]SHN44515.1 Signal transduction histidine kinase [Cryptosporangium aurantiacum]